MSSKRGHDPLFKLFLREPVTARDFLEAHLPEDIRSLVLLDTLRLESGSYVDEELKEMHSDILYSVKMAQDEQCLLYCVVGHQSTEDEMMAWRMTKYTIRAMDDHLKKGYKTLPVVVPLLFYHGEIRPYPYSMDWLDCFEQPELARRVLSKPWPLIDVSVLDDDVIKTHRRMALLPGCIMAVESVVPYTGLPARDFWLNAETISGVTAVCRLVKSFSPRPGSCPAAVLSTRSVPAGCSGRMQNARMVCLRRRISGH